MSHFIHWLHMKRDLIELICINGAVVTISLADIQSIASIALICLTAAYTIYKWQRDLKKEKAKNEQPKT